MQSRLPLVTMLALLTGLASSCSTQNNVSGPGGASTASQDQAEVSSAMADNPSYVNDDVSESPDQAQVGASAVAGDATLSAQLAIRPLFFWRDIRRVERTFDFDFRDPDSTGRPTAAVVTAHRFMQGSFNLVVADNVPEGSPPSSHVISKPLADNAVRRILLRRVLLPDSSRRWRVVAISGVKITSRAATSRLDSLRVQSGATDTTLVNALAFFRLRGLLKLDAGAQVTLTAYTPRLDDVVLLYLRDHRVAFHNNGDGTYTVTFAAPDLPDLHHLGVNVLAHGTLFDDTAAYDSQAWIEPYLVHPILIADGTPDE